MTAGQNPSPAHCHLVNVLSLLPPAAAELILPGTHLQVNVRSKIKKLKKENRSILTVGVWAAKPLYNQSRSLACSKFCWFQCPGKQQK